MHRPDHSTADPDGIIVGVPGYTEGDPLAIPAVPRTIVTADHVNDIGESLCRVVEGAGATLVKSDYNQITDAILGGMDKICASNFEHITVTGNCNAVVHAPFSSGTGVWVRVGDAGLIQRSLSNGMFWFAATAASGYTGDFFCAVFHNDFIVIGGENGVIQYSSDLGATWTQNTLGSPAGKTISGLASDGTNLYAVGSVGGACFVSTATTPGGTWTTRTPPAGTALNAVACRPGLVVAVGHTSLTSGVYAYSTNNGVTWTSVAHASDIAFDVVYEPRGNRFIATSSSLTEGRIWATPPGVATSWSSIRATVTDLLFAKLSAVGNGFVVVTGSYLGVGRLELGHVNSHLSNAAWTYLRPTISTTHSCIAYGGKRLLLGYASGTQMSLSLMFGHRAL